MTSYTDIELRQIAAINEDQHIGLLTACGIHRDHARLVIAMSTADLSAAVAKGIAVVNKTAMQEAIIAAGIRELAIRQ